MNFKLTVAIALLACYPLSGCGNGGDPENAAQSEAHDDHDHDHHGEEGHGHDHPETLAEAVAEIAATSDAIKAAMEADDLKKADGPVHSIGHLLEELEELAKKQELSEEQMTVLTTARDALFEAFAGLDETIHGKTDGKSWADVSETIQKSVSELQSLVAEPAGEEKASS